MFSGPAIVTNWIRYDVPISKVHIHVEAVLKNGTEIQVLDVAMHVQRLGEQDVGYVRMQKVEVTCNMQEFEQNNFVFLNRVCDCVWTKT